MELNTLKSKIIQVKFIIPDKLPKKGLKRLQYYVNFADDPLRYYLGLSLRTSFTKEQLQIFTRNHKVIELNETVVLPFENDLFIDNEGKIWSSIGYDPLNESKKVVAEPKELRKSIQMIKKQLYMSVLPTISKYTSIPSK